MPISEALYSSKTDMWETPQDLFNELDKEFHFDLDVCATQENAKCKRYYTPKQDGLSQPWDGICWCNPPYGRDIGQWVRKAHYLLPLFSALSPRQCPRLHAVPLPPVPASGCVAFSITSGPSLAP